MLFNSFDFFWFFPTVCVVYFLTPQRWRWLLLLVASYYFYMVWKAPYILLIVVSTLIDFMASQRMGVLETKKERRPWLWLSLASNLGILMTFKYYGFFAANLDSVFQGMGVGYALPVSELILPMGISFYTFQTMAYSIDVYNGKIAPERHLGYFALYVSYFPQLVAGPIERAQNLLHQFRVEVEFDYERVVSGLKQMLWGFFKKVVIADRLSVLVEVAYADPSAHEGLTLAMATFFFAFQIYCDFSGYSDIAIGASRVLGIRLMDNFRTPYLSRNISEFWKRWHISLSTWFRDYLYIPLGGNRVMKWRWYYNLMVVFIVSGFWHGANWTFIAWGFLHGFYLVWAIVFKHINHSLSRVIGLSRETLAKKYLEMIATFLLVVLAWVYFRAENVSDANLIVKKILTFDFNVPEFFAYINDLSAGKVLVSIGLLFMFIVLDPFMDSLIKGEKEMKRSYSLVTYSILLALIVVAGNFGEIDFIYFQF